MKNIKIFGGGISGLTVAHELINKGFNVELYEKDDILGGMARSIRKNGIPSEHSWRGYAPFYKNFLNIARQLPKVYDNVKQTIDFYFLRDKLTSYKVNLNLIDYIIIIYYSLKYLTSNKRREEYYKIKLNPMLKIMSNNGYTKLVEHVLGPGLGMEIKDASYAHFFKFIILPILGGKKYKHEHREFIHYAGDNWHVMNNPTSEAWFDIWKDYLIKKGVKIYFNSKLTQINHKNGKVISCIINNAHEIIGHEYVICINPFMAELIFQKSNMTQLYKKHYLMNKNTKSNQISFRIGLNKKIKYPVKNITFTMPDTEFNITWYPQDQHWKKTPFKSLWSGTVINSYTKGKLYNKEAIYLTKKKLKNEIIYQILRSKNFQKLIYDNNQFYITNDDIIYIELWYEWKYKNNKLISDNKKWVNNIYNQQYRPDNITIYDNMYLGGAHTKTTIDIWSMEGAIESGKKISNYILNKYNKGSVIIYKHTDPIYFKLFKIIDDVLYFIKLPNIIDIILIILISIIIKIVFVKNF